MNSSNTLFFRVLQHDPDNKGDALRQAVEDINQGQSDIETFKIEPVDFAAVPGSPFAYWASKNILRLFDLNPQFEHNGRVARVGHHPGEQDRYIRLSWEIPAEPRSRYRQWVPYQKGGIFSKYYADIHLLVDWDFDRDTYYGFHGRKGRSSQHPSNYQFFFRPGLTWPRRTNLFSVRILPKGCVIADKGPGIFIENDDVNTLNILNGLLNSRPFLQLIKIQLARTELARSYEVGVIQNTPVPLKFENKSLDLLHLSCQAYDRVQESATKDEITHSFKIPALLVDHAKVSLYTRVDAFCNSEMERLTQVEAIQTEIDRKVAELYSVPELLEMVDTESTQEDDIEFSKVDDEEDKWETIETSQQDLVSDMLMWCVGVAFGRWDVRFALDHSLLPTLQQPFDPLPVSAPGALVGSEGLPAKSNGIVCEAWLRACPNVISFPEDFPGQATIPDSEYPLNIAWQGLLVDDPTHTGDIITAVRQVFQLIWGDQAAAIESEACQILGFDTLRAWFRDPKKGFYNFHIKRYSKSRRKAPIYWLLQSAKRNYGIWLYYLRLTKDTYFLIGRDYIDTKIELEENRLSEIRQAAVSKSGSALKTHEKEIATQLDLVEEIKAFGEALDEAAFLELEPDLNDGVVLNIAPLREVTSWSEARKYWNELIKGKFTWSTISQQLHKKGHRKG